MTSETSRSRNPAGHTGLLENLFALASALTEFFESRFALVAQESKAALMQVLVLVSCLILALILFAFGYGFLITSVVAGLAHVAGISWLWIALAAAGLHFLFVLVLLLIARNRMTKPVFPATASELKKDGEWLKNLDITNQSTT
jgi:cell division protein FtsW (lipid II flippase)